jgi:hypothetical protein
VLSSERGRARLSTTIDRMYDGLIPGGLNCSDLSVPGGGLPVILDPLVEVPREIQMAAMDIVKLRARPLIPTSQNIDECLLEYRYSVLAHQSHRCCFTCWKKSEEWQGALEASAWAIRSPLGSASRNAGQPGR